MGMFKEEAHQFEDLCNRQKQIYSDACDIGFMKGRDDADLDMAKRLLLHMMNDGLDYQVYSLESLSKIFAVFIIWETEDGLHQGTRYKFEFNEDRSRKVRFLTLSSQPMILSERDLRASYKRKN